MRGERSRKAREANERRSREKAEARRRRERAAARANTAPAGGRTQTWETAQPGKKKTANDYYEEKRKKREKDRKEIDAEFNKAMEETQKMLRERDLGLIDHLDRSTGDTVYNQNYYDLFGMPEGGKDFNRRVERTRNWDKLTDSGKYDRMVYIQEEQERRRKGIPESTGMVYNKGNAGRGTQEGRGPEGNEDAVWSGPYRIGKPEGISEQEWLAMDAKGRLRAVHKGEGRKARDAWNAGERKPREGSADTKGYDAWEALAEAAGKMGTDEGTLREYLAGNPDITLPNGLNAEKIQLSDVRQTNAAVQAKADGTEEVPLFFQGGMDELREYLREHPDVTLPNGMNADILGGIDAYRKIKTEGQQLNPAAPSYLKTQDDIREMQEVLGVAQTGIWDGETDLAYKERMDQADGLIYQDEERIAGLPFDQSGMRANGCSTTATHNALGLMGIDVPFEETYAWHRENEDENWPGTVPWRVEKYIKEEVPGVNIRNAAAEYPVVVPETENTLPLEERAQRVIGEDGHGIICYTYNNSDGSLGAHYVAVEKDPESGKIWVYDYVDDTGKRNTEPQSYNSVHDYIAKKNGGMLVAAYGLSKKEGKE